MHSSKHQDKTEALYSERSSLRKSEETACPFQEARLIEHLKQIAEDGDFVELSS